MRSLLSAHAEAAIRRAAEMAAGRGVLDAGEARRIERGVGRLLDYRRWLAAAAAGDATAIEALRRRLSGVPLPHEPMSIPGPPTPPEFCPVAPVDPLTVLAAGVAVSGDLGDLTWAQRAFAYDVRLAAPIEHLAHAANRWLGGTASDTSLVQAIRVIDVDGPFPDPQALFDPCLSVQHWCFVELLRELAFALLPKPCFPSLGSVVPAEECVGYSGFLAVLPTPGETFAVLHPACTFGERFLAIDGVRADVHSASLTVIYLKLPAGLLPGCHQVQWAFRTTYELPVGPLEQCFGMPPGANVRSYEKYGPAVGFTLTGDPTVERFEGPGGGEILAEACQPVPLSWSVKLDACPGSKSRIAVTLFEDGQVLAGALPAAGSRDVVTEERSTYTLRAEAWLGARRCGVAERQVVVNRQRRIRLTTFERCVDANGAALARVGISCPAPAGGLDALLTSSHPARISSSTAVVPDGSEEVEVELEVGADCGAATVTATAPDHTSAVVELVVADAPRVAPAPATVRASCEPLSLTIDGACLGAGAGDVSAVLTGPAGPVVNGHVTVVAPNSRLLVDLPGLEPGTYLLWLANCGREATVPVEVAVRARMPEISHFSSQPAVVALCTAPAIVLRWTVRYAERVTVTGPDGFRVERTRATSCADWTDFATHQPKGKLTGGVVYTLVAESAAGGERATRSLTVGATPESTGVVHASVRPAAHPQAHPMHQSGSTHDPLYLTTAPHAVITGVRDRSGEGYKLTHRDRTGKYMGPVLMPRGSAGQPGAMVHNFDGLEVEGQWFAEVEGGPSWPMFVNLEVHWQAQCS